MDSLEGEVADEEEYDLEDELTGESDEPVIKFIDGMITRAVRTEVSDIHIEPFEKYLRIRFRQDGTCYEPSRSTPTARSRYYPGSRSWPA